MPTLPPTPANPYKGADATAAVRASLQHALDNYKLGQTNLSLRTGANLERSDTRSFGESHASELSSLASPSAAQDVHPGLSVTPPIPEPTASEGEHGVDQPTQQAPVQPAQSAATQPATASGEAESASEDLYGGGVPRTESAEEEKKRLEREERERVHAAGSEANNERPGTESAEEEKERLEREERERVLSGGAGVPGDTGHKDGDELPPYRAFQQ